MWIRMTRFKAHKKGWQANLRHVFDVCASGKYVPCADCREPQLTSEVDQ
jgi:hypothetical protein